MSFPIVDTSKIGGASNSANLGFPIMPTATTANNNSNNSEIDSSILSSNNNNTNNNNNKNFIENHNNSNEIINFANFNQDFSCISVGYKNGYKVYNCDPFGKAFNKNDSGSIGIVEMLFSSSLLAIVGMGDQNSLSPRRLKIINTKRQTTICELTFPNSILSVKLNRERLIVLLEETIYIYDINNMRLLHTIEIPLNPNGLIALSPSTENNYLAYPSSQKSSPIGSVGATGINSTNSNNLKNNNHNINSSNSIISSNSNLFDSSNNDINGNGMDKAVDINNNNNNNNNSNNIPSLSINGGSSDTSGLAGTGTTVGGVPGVGNTTNTNNLSVRNGDVIIFNAKTLQPLSVIEAHKTSLAAIALSSDGLLLATASDKGTIIRIFSVKTGVKLYQFRRGTYPTKIYSLSFSSDNRFVIASSATETVHIFRLGEDEAANTLKRSGSPLVLAQNPIKKPYNSSASDDGDNDNENDNDNEDDDEEDDEEDDDDEPDILHQPAATLRRKISGSSLGSFNSSELQDGNSNNIPIDEVKPLVDHSRKSVARMLRRTSQSLGRKAAEKMGIYLPPKFSSILEPNRHFASLKVPASKDTKTVVGIGRFPPDDYIPSMFLDTKSQQNQQQQSSSSMFTVNSDDSNNNNNINKLSHSSSSTHSNPLKKLLRIMVITSEGLFYTFGLDPERGGDCILLNQYSLLNDTINTSA